MARHPSGLSWSPDAHAAAGAERLHEGMTWVVDGFKSPTPPGDATAQAARSATHCVRGAEHEYRLSMAELTAEAELRAVFTARELTGTTREPARRSRGSPTRCGAPRWPRREAPRPEFTDCSLAVHLQITFR